MNALSTNEIINSKVVIGTYEGCCGSTLQIGPDRKIYVAHVLNKYIGVIQSPNQLGISCNYIDSSIFLNKVCTYGLPNFINDYYLKKTVNTNNLVHYSARNIIIWPNPISKSSFLHIKSLNYKISRIHFVEAHSANTYVFNNIDDLEIIINISVFNSGVYYIVIYNELNQAEFSKLVIL